MSALPNTSVQIRFFDTREKMNGTRLHLGDGKDGLCYPSAIALLDAGESFAVLDNSGIWQYDMRNEQFLRPVIFPGNSYRRTNDYRGKNKGGLRVPGSGPGMVTVRSSEDLGRPCRIRSSRSGSATEGFGTTCWAGLKAPSYSCTFTGCFWKE